MLQEIAEHMFAETSRPKNYETALELERVCAGIYGPKGIYPNVDFYSGVVYQALGIPTDVFTPIFAIARVAGWLAHWHGTTRRQPHLPPGADLRRQDRRRSTCRWTSGREVDLVSPQKSTLSWEVCGGPWQRACRSARHPRSHPPSGAAGRTDSGSTGRSALSKGGRTP